MGWHGDVVLIGLAIGWACLLHTITLSRRWRGDRHVSEGERKFVLGFCWVAWLPIMIGWTLYAAWQWVA